MTSLDRGGSSEIPTSAENGEYGRQIAEESPAAAGLLVQIMDRNARAAEKLDAWILEAQKRETEEWKERALAAEAQLDRIEDRLMGLLR